MNRFEQLNPFSQKQTKLYSLSTGHTKEECDEINCDDAKLIGYNMQNGLDCKRVEERKVNRYKQVRTIQPLKKGTTIESQVVYIDPSIIFNGLTILMERTEKTADYFQQELCKSPLYGNFGMQRRGK